MQSSQCEVDDDDDDGGSEGVIGELGTMKRSSGQLKGSILKFDIKILQISGKNPAVRIRTGLFQPPGEVN